jgi:phasin protein
MPDETTGARAEVGFAPFATPFGLEALVELNRPALAAMAQVNGKVYENIAAMNKSWAEFLNRRLQKELGVPKQLAECKSLPEMYSVCADFFQAAMADYQTEFEAMSKLGKTLADDTLQAMQVRAEETASGSRPH